MTWSPGSTAAGTRGVRPAHEFALRSIDVGADTASELGRRLSVSKQAAAKTIASLQQLGYVAREVDPSDGRRKRVRLTPRGYEVMAIGGALFDDVRERWAAQIGARQLDNLQGHLGQLVQRRTFGADDLARFDDTRGATG
jgi:DNA-binding MarR family transcriptional regulator